MKYALITGAATGIGRATAVELGNRGYKTGLVGRNRRGLEETGKLVGQADIWVCDLREVKQIMEMAGKIDRVDVLVNTAGIWHGENEAYAGIDLEKFDRTVIADTVAVGLTAPMLLIHGLLSKMSAGGGIVNVSGTFENGGQGWLPYFAAKRALEDLTLGLSEELKDRRVRVNCVSPSDTASEAYIRYFPQDAKDANSPEQVAKLIAEVAEKDETGKFWVIKQGRVFEGFHR